jgi:hypothetical protein
VLRTCSKCRKPEGEVEFPPYRSAYCNGCRVLVQRDYSAKNRETTRAAEKRQRADRHKRDPEGEWRKELDKHLRSHFRITVDDYDRMYEVQGGRCGICGKPGRGSSKPPDGKPRLAVDHDRRCCPGSNSCGRCVRGLLCGSCNPKIGFFELFEAQCLAWRDRRFTPAKEVVIDARKAWRVRAREN